MQDRYDLRVTKYFCTRCGTPIDVPSDSFYWFGGTNDPAFWCPTCEDFPRADYPGIPAEDVPRELHVGKDKGFPLRSVPTAEPSDVNDWNLLYRPYSKRSFLKQYIDWLTLSGVEPRCTLSSTVTTAAKFDPVTQQYIDEIEYTITDDCENAECQFLQHSTLKPEEVACPIMRMLCDVRGPYGLCDTGDEAMILQQFLTLTGERHFPMLVPQASILRGKRRADFVCFVPLTKFQYHKMAVLVDRPGKHRSAIEAENSEYKNEGFVVERILIDRKDPQTSYFKIARELALRLERL